MPHPVGAILDTSVPILGQRYTLTGCTLLPVLVCACGKGDPITLAAQLSGGQWRVGPAPCSACGAMFQMAGVSLDAAGQLVFAINVGLPER